MVRLGQINSSQGIVEKVVEIWKTEVEIATLRGQSEKLWDQLHHSRVVQSGGKFRFSDFFQCFL